MTICGVWRENQAVEWSGVRQQWQGVGWGGVETVRQRGIDYFLKYFLFKIIIFKNYF
jgi:hypothetical protein